MTYLVCAAGWQASRSSTSLGQPSGLERESQSIPTSLAAARLLSASPQRRWPAKQLARQAVWCRLLRAYKSNGKLKPCSRLIS